MASPADGHEEDIVSAGHREQRARLRRRTHDAHSARGPSRTFPGAEAHYLLAAVFRRHGKRLTVRLRRGSTPLKVTLDRRNTPCLLTAEARQTQRHHV
jgi:hypothetical protein